MTQGADGRELLRGPAATGAEKDAGESQCLGNSSLGC
jgi:hypothetical protein